MAVKAVYRKGFEHYKAVKTPVLSL